VSHSDLTDGQLWEQVSQLQQTVHGEVGLLAREASRRNWAKLCIRYSSYHAVNTPSVIQTSQLMLYREIIAVCSQIHTKHINTVCGQNVELLNVKLVVHIATTGL
jgi:hypothetical protein